MLRINAPRSRNQYYSRDIMMTNIETHTLLLDKFDLIVIFCCVWSLISLLVPKGCLASRPARCIQQAFFTPVQSQQPTGNKAKHKTVPDLTMWGSCSEVDQALSRGHGWGSSLVWGKSSRKMFWWIPFFRRIEEGPSPRGLSLGHCIIKISPIKKKRWLVWLL